MSDIQIFLFCASAILLQAFTLYKLYTYRVLLEEKNLKLIQFYLDMKFIWQCISQTLSNTSTMSACNKLIDSIKDYYSFEDLIVFGSNSFPCKEEGGVVRKDVMNYISQNKLRIKEFLKGHDFFIEDFWYQEINYNLYITSASNSSKIDNGFIIGIDRNQHTLSRNEMVCLENSINLLKLNMSYL